VLSALPWLEQPVPLGRRVLTEITECLSGIYSSSRSEKVLSSAISFSVMLRIADNSRSNDIISDGRTGVCSWRGRVSSMTDADYRMSIPATSTSAWVSHDAVARAESLFAIHAGHGAPMDACKPRLHHTQAMP